MYTFVGQLSNTIMKPIDNWINLQQKFAKEKAELMQRIERDCNNPEKFNLLLKELSEMRAYQKKFKIIA